MSRPRDSGRELRVDRPVVPPSTGLHPGAQDRDNPSWARLFVLWAATSFRSFGGGQAVQLYAYHGLVESRRWLTPERWGEAYGLCQIVPGINIIAVALLTGRQLAGTAGAAASVAGLMVPSVVITVALTHIYTRIADLAILQGILRGVATAAAGMSISVAWRLLRPALKSARTEGAVVLGFTIAILGGSGALVVVAGPPVFVILLAAGGLMAIVLVGLEHSKKSTTE